MELRLTKINEETEKVNEKDSVNNDDEEVHLIVEIHFSRK